MRPPANVIVKSDPDLFEPRSFQPRNLGTPFRSLPGQDGYELHFSGQPSKRCSKSETRQWTLSRLSLDVGIYGSVALTGKPDTALCRFDFVAEARAEVESIARNSLEPFALIENSGTIILRTFPRSAGVQTRAYLNGSIPAHLPVAVTGSYAAIEIVDLAAPLTASTSHGGLTLLNVSGPVRADVREGFITYAGHGGDVSLTCDLAIDLCLRETSFEGVLEAQAEGTIRLFIPAGFQSAIAVEVERPEDFHLRSTTLPNTVERSATFQIGSGTPAVRLAAKEVRIVEVGSIH